MRILALILTLTAAPAWATQEYILPTLFDVTGVAADDVLNIRETPSASAAIIGTLAPDATRIEVVDETRGWALVNTGERSGWVNARYLMYRTDVWPEQGLPDHFACYGTEPFWSARVEGDALILDEPEATAAPRPLRAVFATGVFREPRRAVLAGDVTLVATPKLCSDGMSDRLFGLEATLIEDGDTPRMMTGCCSIAPPR